MVAAKNSPTDTPNHRAVSAHEGCDGGFVLLLDEAPQQLPIRQPRLILAVHGPAEVLNDLGDLGRHRGRPSNGFVRTWTPSDPPRASQRRKKPMPDAVRRRRPSTSRISTERSWRSWPFIRITPILPTAWPVPSPIMQRLSAAAPW